MKLPSKVKVGHVTYRLTVWPADFTPEDRWGECDRVGAVIRIRDNHTGPRGAETVLHEVMHAIYHEADLSAQDGEERMVTRLSSMLATVLHDNPKLLEWISAELKA